MYKDVIIIILSIWLLVLTYSHRRLKHYLVMAMTLVDHYKDKYESYKSRRVNEFSSNVIEDYQEEINKLNEEIEDVKVNYALEKGFSPVLSLDGDSAVSGFDCWVILHGHVINIHRTASELYNNRANTYPTRKEAVDRLNSKLIKINK